MGPPGTGKTYTLSKIAASYYRKSKRILLLSHSNAAVDGLLQETARQLKKKEAWKKENSFDTEQQKAAA
ncbi:AAA domain-containing protein [Priestia megaterium]